MPVVELQTIEKHLTMTRHTQSLKTGEVTYKYFYAKLTCCLGLILCNQNIRNDTLQ